MWALFTNESLALHTIIEAWPDRQASAVVLDLIEQLTGQRGSEAPEIATQA